MIRRRLVVAVSVVAALAVLAGGWLVLVTLEDRLVDNLDRDFRNGRLSSDLRDVVVDFRGDTRRQFDRLDPVQGIAVIRYDAGGDVVGRLASGPRNDPDPLPQAASVPPSGRLTTVASDGGPRYRVAAFSTADGGTVAVGISMATIDETVRDARRILLVFGVGAVAAIAALSWVLIRRAMAPVEGMIATADRIAAGDLTQRTDATDSSSEVGRLATALDAMLDRIEDALSAKTESEARMRTFVAEASHELRTPLTSVRGYAELYRSGADDPDSVAAGMAAIESEATRMSRLVESLLQLARLDRAVEPDRASVDLTRLVGEAVDAARVVDGTRTWELDVPGDLDATVPGDADQLRQVLDNLLVNARVHTPPGTTVTTALRADDDAATLVVADDGPGFDAPDAGRAFDRFWRATRSDRSAVPGTGLGLAIVSSIAQAHGGDVVLDGRPGGGARFTVTLPRR